MTQCEPAATFLWAGSACANFLPARDEAAIVGSSVQFRCGFGVQGRCCRVQVLGAP